MTDGDLNPDDARLGAQLRAARPQLSAAALARAHAAMRRELNIRNETRRSFQDRRRPLVAAIAALFAVGLLIAWYAVTVTPHATEIVQVKSPGEAFHAAELEQRRREELKAKYALAKSPAEQAALAAELAKITPDNQIPQWMRFDAAMGLVNPRLKWHAAGFAYGSYFQSADRLKHARADQYRFEAHNGEQWMRDAIPANVKFDLKTHSNGRLARQEARLQSANEPEFFWTVDDPKSPDVTRAVALLGSVHDDVSARWVDALRINNTVLTMDVRGGYASGSAAPIVLDARAADEITFKLYRVADAAKLQAAAQRIGTDYIFADHAEIRAEQLDMVKYAIQDEVMKDLRKKLDPLPEFSNAELAGSWHVAVGEMKALHIQKYEFRDRWWDDAEENDEPDAAYFDDACSQFAARLHREYWPEEDELSAWTCARKFEIPAASLQPGAYVLVAEANGTRACAPILVDSLSLTLRRCRDGVMVVASDNQGAAPVARARVLADGMLQPSSTDASGVAFARVFAAGDKPILVEKDGRFAIGGFGKVFDGIYNGPEEYQRERWDLARSSLRQARATERDLASEDAVGQVFEDRHVAAAYTDRPTYRPGQDVQFKLIVRTLGQPLDVEKSRAPGFRDEDFDRARLLQLPNPGTTVAYEALDKKGRSIASGAMGLNEFGTASGTIHLSDECATGACALRINLNGTARILPDIFTVKNYRRPNFEVALKGLPENLTKLAGQKLTLEVSAKYYFGKTVAGGTAHVRLVHADSWRPLAEKDVVLSNTGDTVAVLQLPEKLIGGAYHVICAVTDDSNQTVTQTAAANVDLPPAVKADSLADLPRFAPASEVLHISGLSTEVTAKHGDVTARFTPDAKGVAELKLGTGWWTLSADGKSASLFVYGEGAYIFSNLNDEEKGFVNIANYGSEESGMTYEYNGRKPELWALFGRQHAEVGGTIKVLLYAPNATRALLTMEGRTVLDYVIVPLDGASSYHVVEIPIRERHVPNFYLQGCAIGHLPGNMAVAKEVDEQQKLAEELIGNEGEDPKWCRVDVLDPHAKQGGEKLNVEVRCDAAEHKPGDEVGVTVRVTGLDGKPREAEVSLAAIDASLYAFGEDRSGTLAQTFADARPDRRFLPKAWKISTGRLFHERERQKNMEMLRQADQAKAQAAMAMDEASQKLAQSARLERALDRALEGTPLGNLGEMPVTQIPLTGWRTDFRETAAWLPQLRTDAQGRVAAHFKLPDSLTRYRVNAVGLTRQTEIGSGRSDFVATLPLSVQVFLPRFAVEGDRLQATGLIHNTTGKDVTVPFAFEIQNATCAGPAADTVAQMSFDGASTLVQGKVLVAAHGSAHIGAWLSIDKLGSVRVGLRAGDKDAADAEQRDLPVIPDGRPLDVALSGASNGEIQLPIGYVPTDLRLSVSRSVPAEALQGLGYLIDYPYGCVEQTMSRFLPSVMVKHAWQQGVCEVPADVMKRAPDVLQKGLERLYNFQHTDGGWGWWEHDATNDGMSVYVVYGLARCKTTGTPVNADVFARGCAFLKSRLNDDKFDRQLWARGWQALALAGTVSADELKVALKKVDATLPPESLASLALACKTLGLDDDAAALRAKLQTWAPQSAESLAMKLNVETAFGDVAPARITADALMAQRTGLRWLSTKDTSWAIEAMTGLVTHLPPLGPARAFKLSMAGQTLIEATTAAQLTKRVFDLHLTGAQLPLVERAVLTLNADFPEPLHYALNATGYQHLQKVEPTGTSVQMTRKYLTTDDKPLATTSKVGDCIAVHVTVKLERRQEYVMLEDRRPAGWEFAADVLHGEAAGHAANTEFRDDRLCVFFDALEAGEHELVYYLRAETPGVSHVIPGCTYPMYGEKTRGETGADVLEIK